MKQMTCLLLICIVFLTACAPKAEVLTWQEQYDLGVRYLSEGNYEEAILAFNVAIEIDPKRPEAYVSLAEIYTELGESEKLSEVLDAAKEQFGEEEFMDLLLGGELEADLGHNPMEEENELIRAGDSITATGIVRYSDAPSDIGEEYCFIEDLPAFQYEFNASNDSPSQSYAEVVFTKDEGADLELMKQYIGKYVTISGRFESDIHGVPYITDIAVTESSGGAKAFGPLVLDNSKVVICTNNNITEYSKEAGTLVPNPQTYHSCYHIPQLNLPRGLGKEVNDKIYREWSRRRDEMIEFIGWMGSYCISYEWYQNGDVISIVIKATENSPLITYQVYNVSAKTGEELPAAEILACCGMDEKEFYSKMRERVLQQMETSLWKQYDSLSDYYSYNEVKQMEEAGVSKENMKPYIGKNGQLCVKYYLPGLSQFDGNYLVNFATGEVCDIAACAEEHDGYEAVYLSN